jgi:hypothetical protein
MEMKVKRIMQLQISLCVSFAPPLVLLLLSCSSTMAQGGFASTPVVYSELLPPAGEALEDAVAKPATDIKQITWVEQLVKESEASVGRLYFGTEHANWKMRRRDLDFAVTHSGTALAIGSGEIKELSFDRDNNFKAFLGFKLDDGWKAGIVYSNYRTSQSMALESQFAGSLFATRSHPKYNEEAFDAEIAAVFESNVFDAEVRGDINLSDRASITVFGGFRWMDVTQSVVTAYDGLDFNEGLITQQNQSDLFGLRFGGVGSFNISDDFYLFGSLEATIAYGDHAVSLNEMDNEFGTQDILVDVQDTYGQGHLLSAAAFGVGWEFTDGCDLKLGYEVNYWGGLADRLVFLDDTHEAMFSHETEDILMDGFFVRLSRDY